MNDRINNEPALLAFKNKIKHSSGKKYKLWAGITVF